MLFSEHFEITLTQEDSWFDPILFADTKLFLDPFLLFDGEFGEFEGSHKEIVGFFDYIFQLIAKSQGNTQSRQWREALSLLELQEVSELCLGYAGSGTRGSGSGTGLALQMARGLWAAVRQGIDRLEHFEEVQIFEEGIGADRISDATAGIIRHRLARYTQAVVDRHNIAAKEMRYGKSRFDPEKERWITEKYRLPINPYTDMPLLLVPRDYLRSLPTINPNDFWDFCFTNSNDTIRREFGNEITRNVDKRTIVDFAKRHPELRERYVKSKEVEGGEPYDLRADPSGFYQPFLGARGWSANNLLRLSIASAIELFEAINRFTEQFKNYVENQHGWQLLWNDDRTPKKEVAFQALFSGVMIPHCQANDIDISKEANIGRGPVDFKFSQGYQKRVLIEAKLASNSKFWSGLKTQLPKYLQAECIEHGIFLVACQREQDFKRLKGINEVAAEVSQKSGVEIRVIAVDCSAAPPSASNLFD